MSAEDSQVEGQGGASQPGARRLSRLAAVQALYQMDVNGSDAAQVVREFLDHRLNEAIDGLSLQGLDREFFRALVTGVAIFGLLSFNIFFLMWMTKWQLRPVHAALAARREALAAQQAST